MVIRSYGFDWDYNLYLVPDKIIPRVERLMEEGKWAMAFELIRENDKTENKDYKRKDWYDLNTIDFLLEYIEGVTV